MLTRLRILRTRSQAEVPPSLAYLLSGLDPHRAELLASLLDVHPRHPDAARTPLRQTWAVSCPTAGRPLRPHSADPPSAKQTLLHKQVGHDWPLLCTPSCSEAILSGQSRKPLTQRWVSRPVSPNCLAERLLGADAPAPAGDPLFRRPADGGEWKLTSVRDPLWFLPMWAQAPAAVSAELLIRVGS